MSNLQVSKILIIDDDENIRRILQKILENSGAIINQCPSVREGIRLASDLIPHLIFLDINFPGESGFSFLAAKKAIATLDNCHVVMMSTEAFSANVKKSLKMGAHDFISKPLVNYVVMQKARKALLQKSLNSITISENHIFSCNCVIDYKAVAVKERMISLLSAVRFGDHEKISIIGESSARSGNSATWKTYRKIGESGTIYKGVYRSVVSLMGDNPPGDAINRSSLESYDEEDIVYKHRPRMFVLDDDQNFTQLIQYFYRRYGANVEVFSSIEEIKNALLKELPAVCILDLSIKYPNDVFSLIEYLKFNYPLLPMIVATKNTDEIAVKQAIELGADDYVYKPIRKDHLLHKVVRAIAKNDLAALDRVDLMSKKERKLSAGKLSFALKLQKVDELGMHLVSNSFLGTGTKINLESDEFVPVIGQRSVGMRIAKVGRDLALGKYCLYGKFTDLNSEKINKIFNYCGQRK